MVFFLAVLFCFQSVVLILLSISFFGFISVLHTKKKIHHENKMVEKHITEIFPPHFCLYFVSSEKNTLIGFRPTLMDMKEKWWFEARNTTGKQYLQRDYNERGFEPKQQQKRYQIDRIKVYYNLFLCFKISYYLTFGTC